MLTDIVPEGEAAGTSAPAAEDNPDLLQDAVDSMFG
jgi:hypothetical protein